MHAGMDPSDGDPSEVTIRVNDVPIRITGRQATALEIKKAAIEQGLAIEIDFDLSELLSGNWARPIDDDFKLQLSDASRFVANDAYAPFQGDPL
jgi:hypothetical protein